MAYNVKGKIYTDNSLMDEIVHNCKLILNGVVVKNDVLANNSETENSLTYAEIYYIQREDGFVPFSVFPFNYEILSAFGYSDPEIEEYLRDKNNIPVEDRNNLTTFANKYFKENFEEENDYYRMLNGLPPFDTGEEFYVYITQDDLPAKYNKNIDETIPLHEQPLEIVNILYNCGKMDELRETYKTTKYGYLNFLGPKKIDLYKARKANKWDILYIPAVPKLVIDKFTEFYKINREIYLNQSYQESFSDTSEYYNQIMIITLLAQTFADMVTDVPEWYIRRDIFDIRSVKYFLDSYGIEFFKEIPLKYQIAIVKNANKLIKYKSSTMNMQDIADLFVNENIRILKYWLLKKRLMDSNGNYISGETEQSKYGLEFISSAIDESYDAYIKNSIYRRPYDDITYDDKYWDGQDTHRYIKNRTLEKDFTINGTKYMSIEYIVSLSEYNFQVEYFLGLLLDSKVNTNDILISVPVIDENAEFPLSDVFIYAILLSDSYYAQSSIGDMFEIRRPSIIGEGNEPTIDEDHYDWRVRNIPQIFVPKKGRVHAFNPRFDRQGITDLFRYGRHSHYLFGASYENVDFDNPGKDTPLTDQEYAARAITALDELGVNDFITPAASYETIEELVEVYKHDKQCYELLIDKIKEADNEDDLSTLTYLYQEMYTREFDSDFYTKSDGTNAKDLVEVLLDRNYILYESYQEIMYESNIDSRRDQIRKILNDVVETLEYYLSDDGLNYLFSFTPIESFYSIVYYIWLMINFFKSYKVQFLDPFATFMIDNKLDPDSIVKTSDKINEWKITNGRRDKAFTTDYSSSNISYDFKTDEGKILEEAIDYYAHQDRDPLEDQDYNGFDAEKGEETGFTEIDGGVAEDSKNAPYIEVDAGKSYLSATNIDNIDGGNADESYEEYLEIDGGEAYHPDDQRKDWFGTQCFNYDLDGGSSTPHYFRSRSLEVNISGNNISMNVVPSKREDNYIIILDDGVYIADKMVDQYDFDGLVAEFNQFIKEVEILNNDIIALIKSIDSFDDIKVYIQSIIQAILYNMKTSVNDILNNGLYNRVVAFVDAEEQFLENRYKDANPYGWVELSS